MDDVLLAGKEIAVRPRFDFDIEDLRYQAQAMQEQLVAAQAGLAEAEAIGSAGGGLVRITMTANGEVRSVHIDPKAVDPNDMHSLESLIIVAIRDVHGSIREMAEDLLRPVAETVARLRGT